MTWEHPFAPSTGATPPLNGIFDEPASHVAINRQWAKHVISALAQLHNRDNWKVGKDFAQQEIIKLIECIILGDCAECEECPPIEPPTIRAGQDCIEWLNPITQAWECVASYPERAVCDVCDCEIDECEDEMCKCQEGMLRVDPCNPTQLQTMKNGAWENYALPTELTQPGGIITPPEDTPETNSNACHKATGAWNLLEATMTALLDTLNQTVNSTGAYLYWQQHHPEIDEDNATLWGAIGNYASGFIGNVILPAYAENYWNENKDAIRNEFTCAMQYLFSPTATLGDREIDKIREWQPDTGNTDVDDLLKYCTQIPQRNQFKSYAATSVMDESGDCDCTGAAPTDPNAPPEIPEGSSALLFKQFVGGINWTPGNKWSSIAAALGSGPRGSRVGSNVWQLEYDAFDDPNDGSIYSIGILLEFTNVNATTLHKVNFTWQGNSGAGYTAPKVLWHNAVNPATAWNEVIPSPDGHNPIPASQNYDITMNVSNVRYVAIWMNAVWSGASPLTGKVGRINSLYLDATVSGTRYNIIIPDQIITP